MSLLAHYKFDKEVLDFSGNNNHGILTGSTFVEGKKGKAILFDGISDKVEFPDTAVETLTGSIALSFWAKIEAAENTSLFYQQNLSTGYNINIHFPWGSNVIYWDCGSDGVASYNRISKTLDAGYIGDDTFHHWVFQLNSKSNWMEIYLDGVLWHSGAGSGFSLVNSGKPFYLGTQGVSTFWAGTVDELKIYDTPLSADGVLRIYELGYTGILAHYPLKTDTLDMGPFGLDGIPSNLTYGYDATLDKSVAIFNGTTSKITITNDPLLQIVDELTICFMMKFNDTTLRLTVINKAYGGEFTINLEPALHLRFYHGDAGASASPYESLNSSLITEGDWHHYAIVKDKRKRSTWYIDGELATFRTGSYSGSASTADIIIGTGYTGGYLDGSMSDLRFYRRCLTQSDIKTLAGIPSVKKQLGYDNSLGLLAHYTCRDKQFYAVNYLGDGIGGINAHDPSGWNGGADTGRVSEFGTPILALDADVRAYDYTIDEVLDANFSLADDLCVFSIYVRRLEGPEEGRIRMYDNISGYTYQTINVTTEFQRFSMTKTFGTAPTRIFVMIDGNQYSSGNYEYHSAQLELKDIPTNFTKSAASGVLLDSSGNNNHGVMGNKGNIAISNSPEWVEDHPWSIGSYKFRASINNLLWLPPSLMNGLLDFTFSCWIYLHDSTNLHAILSGANSINFNEILFYLNDNRKLAFQLQGVSTTVTDTIIPLEEWHMVTWVREGSEFRIYLDAINILTEVTSGLPLEVTGLVIGQEQDSLLGGYQSNQSFVGNLAEFRVYNTALDSVDLEILMDNIQTRVSLDNEGNLWTDVPIKTDITNKLLVDHREWILGSTGHQGSWTDNGDEAENSIVRILDPWGRLCNAWFCNPDAVSGADGGWNKAFETDPSYKHRFTVFVKKWGSLDGSFYHGCDNGTYSNTLNLSGSQNTNPYFRTGEPPALDTWYLLVGLLHEVGYGTTDTGVSGLYSMDGIKLVAGTEYKSNGGTRQKMRNYLYYSTDLLVHQYFIYPRVDRIDGTEPSIAELVAGLDSYEFNKFLSNGKFLLNQSEGSLHIGKDSISFPTLEFDDTLPVQMRFEDSKAYLKGSIYSQYEIVPETYDVSVYGALTFGDAKYGDD